MSWCSRYGREKKKKYIENKNEWMKGTVSAKRGVNLDKLKEFRSSTIGFSVSWNNSEELESENVSF